MLVYLTLFTCAALMVLLVRRYDLYEKEPWYMVVLAVAVGIALMWTAGQIEDLILPRFHLTPDMRAHKAAIVTLVEETAKLLVVVVIARLFPRHFNDALDGLVYGTLGGLGMALEESMMYLRLTPDKDAMALGTEVVRLFAHSLMGGLAGFAVGLTMRPGDSSGAHRKIVLPFTCVSVAMVVHFCWDYIAYAAQIAVVMRGVLMLLMLSLMLVWGAMVAYAMELSRKVVRGAVPATS
jgi:RsiW-degrading membrane proteinase PrsW (M82 family)